MCWFRETVKSKNKDLEVDTMMKSLGMNLNISGKKENMMALSEKKKKIKHAKVNVF